MRRRAAMGWLLLGLALVPSSACFVMPTCDCAPTLVPLPDAGAWRVTDLRVEDAFDGGGGRAYGDGPENPWGDVSDAVVAVDGEDLTVTYDTPQGRFEVRFRRAP